MKTIAEALGAKPGEPICFNTKATATCPHCGAEPKLMQSNTGKGRQIAYWQPPVRCCKGKS